MDTAQLVLLVLIAAAGVALFFVRRRRLMIAREAYGQALADAVADGILTDEEVAELSTLQKKGALSAVDVRSAGIAIYREALEEAAADSRLTAEEDAALHRLQQQLGLTEADLATDFTQVARLRMLARIEQGHFTEVRSPIQLVPDEVCYWVAQCTLAERLSVRSARRELRGITFMTADNTPFSVVGDTDPLRPAEDILPSDLGVLVITSRRTVFQGAKRTASVPHARLESVMLYDDGMRIDELKPPAKRYLLLDDPELAVAILIQAARTRRAQLRPNAPDRTA
jgi:hypothetical protein